MADDDPDDRLLVEEALEEGGASSFQLRCVGDGEERGRVSGAGRAPSGGPEKELLRVLLVEDDEDDYVIISDLLSEIEELDLEWVSDYDEALVAIGGEEHDVCLLDYRLGGRSGLDLLRAASERGHKTPMILLTGRGDRELDLEAMQAGAADYLVKGQIDAPLLERSIRYAFARRRAEKALRESEQKFRSIVETTEEWVWAWDDRGWITYSNPAVEDILGYRPEELVGQSALAFVHEKDRREIEVALPKLIASKSGWSERVLRWRHKDGTYRYLESNAVPILDDHAEVVEYRGTARDVTERKRAEEGLREANRRLKELAVLTADFTAMVAHELDTPLAVIRGYAEILAAGDLGPDEQLNALEKIRLETQVLGTLVADVKAAASVEREDFAVKLRRVPVGALIEEATRFAATLPGAPSFEVSNNVDGQVWADLYRIGQVLRNLLSNAAKYSPDGAPIELRVEPGETPGRIRFEVADRGVGIHPEDAARIFEKFGRGRDRSGRRVAGVGLGLYLSRRIVRAHDGDLTLEPGPAGGSVASFELKEVP